MSGLIVPVDVLAYCIGTVDAGDNGPARAFAGATTNFANQTTDDKPAFLGINVSRDSSQSPLWPMEAGVHLHWAMPDALTRASGDGSLTFPQLPNRWLVTRVVGNAAGKKHWIVHSDALSTTPPAGKRPPTVPVHEPGAGLESAPQRGFRYLGAWQVFDGDWREPSIAREHTLKALSGYELHAVATGDIAFAAFYPNARSVFGFYDDLADLSGAAAELMYVVVGWYGTAANDPLNGGLVLTQLKTQLGWTFASQSKAPVTYSLYSGLVQGIAWNPATRYVSDDPEPIAGDVAIGNHPAEALAAYFRGRNHPSLPAFEELFTAFATGLMPTLATPAAGQLATLEEALHELQFTGFDGGTIYTISRGTAEATDLPLPLADALNLLNRAQQAADVAAVQVRQAKWQLFAYWARLFDADPNRQDAAFLAFTTQVDLQGAIARQAASTAGAAAKQKTAVTQMLSGGLTLTPVPAARYYTPTEPIVLLAGDAAAPAERYGGDGRYHPAGFLVCRLDTDVLQGLTIAPATTLQASQFSALTPGTPNLPYPAIATLIEEAALLDTAVGAAASGASKQDLAVDLVAWLEGGTAKLYGKPVGVPPSPVAANVWPGANPWLSLMLLWEVHFHPLLATAGAGGLVDYPPGFFTANYSLDPNSPRMITYAPGHDGITIDPASIDFDPANQQSGTQRYQGASVLSPTAADNLRDQLAKYPGLNADATLKAVSDQLAGTDIAMQSLTGLNDALLTRRRSLQLQIGVSPTAPMPFRQATRQLTSVVTSLADIPPLAPEPTGAFNVLRAGYMQLSLQVMDPFGRKRPVKIDNLYIAESFATYARGALEPAIAFVQPRLAQPSRLMFRWLAADSTEYDEMNAHPATTPVCGWVLPDHLAVGFFFYDRPGNPLGSLTLRADGSGLVWQATPGDQATIDADLETVMRHQNPHLREVARALAGSTPARFRAFWQAADRAITKIVPAAPASASGLAVLVGRPLAVVQASLRLERQGIAAFDQTFATLSNGNFVDTDHALGGVGFPVVIGDLQRLDDGLVGYFKQAGASYDTAVFYSQAAPDADPGVAVPAPTNVLLTPAATAEAVPDQSPTETKLLMLVDPRAAVHATMGVLPTQALVIPSEQYEDILTGLEMTFPANPLLRPAGGLAVPLPAIGGYNWSWITEQRASKTAAIAGSGSTWTVDPDLREATAGAVWQYGPQSLTEGWLRLNPELLQFRLSNTHGAPVVTAGTTASLTLTVTNRRRIPITFKPAAIVNETSLKEGSLFYIHFGSLVADGEVAAMTLAAPGWQFRALRDAQYGNYWGASPVDTAQTLVPGAQPLSITVGNVAVALGSGAQSRIYFDYYNVTGCDDGIDEAVLAVQQPKPKPAAA